MHTLTWIQDGKIRQVQSSADTCLALFRLLMPLPGIQDLILSNGLGILKVQHEN